MIRKLEIERLVREWCLREDVVEKDYVLGWVLWGIGSDPVLDRYWVFKGGTCLKKCFYETYRFSEDLDFTVLPGGPVAPKDVRALLARVQKRIHEASGIGFPREPFLRERRSGGSTEGRLYYVGPRGAPEASIKLDLSGAESVVRTPVLRDIRHPFGDRLPRPGQVRCYDFDELFAEKIRAMGERCRPRDLYDIINLYRRSDLGAHPKEIARALREKCETKGVPLTTLEAITASSRLAELESEWKNMLAHQLPAVPPLEQFLEELPTFFEWLAGKAPAPSPPPVPADADATWAPPPTMWTWRERVPIEPLRFAAMNRLCVQLGYKRTSRLIAPYSLARSRAGRLLLYARRVDNQKVRTYRVDLMESIEVTKRPFVPMAQIRFTRSGPIPVPLVRTRTAKGDSRASFAASRFLVVCPSCGRRFVRRTRYVELRPHANPRTKNPCHTRRGVLRW